MMEKNIIFEKHVLKEILAFPQRVQEKLASLITVLERKGELQYPDAKKLQSEKNLFEIRIKYKVELRIIYAYVIKNRIIMLSAFHKKSQKTPIEEIHKARKRLRMLQEEK
jgi:phage-related protein